MEFTQEYVFQKNTLQEPLETTPDILRICTVRIYIYDYIEIISKYIIHEYIVEGYTSHHFRKSLSYFAPMSLAA